MYTDFPVITIIIILSLGMSHYGEVSTAVVAHFSKMHIYSIDNYIDSSCLYFSVAAELIVFLSAWQTDQVYFWHLCEWMQQSDSRQCMYPFTIGSWWVSFLLMSALKWIDE